MITGRLTAAPAQGRRTGTVSRLGWGLGDQSLSSLSNFIVGIAVARSVTMSDFGIYALAFSVYSLVLGVSRALTTEPYAVMFTAAAEYRAKPARASATGLAVAVGLATLVIAMGVAALVPTGLRPIVLVLGVIMPGLLLQDAWRQVFFAAGHGAKAFSNDLIWALLLIPAFGLVFWHGPASAADLMLAWGLAGTLAGAFGVAQSGTLPNVLASKSWLSNYRSLWPRYLGEGMAINGAQQLVFFAVGAISGFAAVGQLKLVMVVLGPVNVLVQGVGMVAVPEAARALAAGWRKQQKIAVGISSLVAGGALLWGLAVLFLPASWGVALAGAGWVGVTALVAPLCLIQVLNGSNTGPAVSLRVMGAAKVSLNTRLASSALVVVGAVLGALTAGGVGAAWGMAAAASINASNWYVQYRRTRSKFMTDSGAFSASMTPLNIVPASTPGVSK